jgi:hypothetical protein
MEKIPRAGTRRRSLYDLLVSRPGEWVDFDPNGGMRTTIAIQLKRLHNTGKLVITSEPVEGRGVVYTAEPTRVG